MICGPIAVAALATLNKKKRDGRIEEMELSRLKINNIRHRLWISYSSQARIPNTADDSLADPHVNSMPGQIPLAAPHRLALAGEAPVADDCRAEPRFAMPDSGGAQRPP